jgi:adenylate cyclase
MVPAGTGRASPADQNQSGGQGTGRAVTATAAPRRKPRISLKVSLVAISLLTVAFTAAAVHLPWLFVSRDNVAEMARQLNGEIVSGVNREVSNIFDSAIAAQSALHDALYDGVIDIEDKRSRDRLFFALLNANPHFSWVSFGKPNGDFYGAQRRDEVNLRIADSKWFAARNEAERTEDYFVNDGERISLTVTKHKVNDYYSPARAWYRLAIRNPGQHIWTDIYVFDVSRKPGLNTAITLNHRSSGDLVGVVSIAIELERISRYLAGLTSLRSGSAFIIDREGHLVAFPDPREITRPSRIPDQPELTPLKDSYHPMLQVAQAGIVQSGLKLEELSATRQMVTEGPNGGRYFLTLAPSVRDGWLIGTVIPEKDFMGPIEANYVRLALAVLIAVLVVGAMAIVVSRYLFVAPLQRLMGETRKIAQFDLDDVRRVPSPLIEIDALSNSIEQMSRGLGSFRRYLPADLVRTLMDKGVVAELGGERRTMSVMFMDLEGFTALSERMGHRVVPILGDYFGAMSGAIQDQRGTIDKFIGDAVMAFWGAPHYDEDHPSLVCRAALDCAARMEDLRGDWARRGLPELNIRIGINSGRMVVGNIGSPDRLNYTVIGDPVNLAARLEGMNREFGTSILISQHTFELAKYDIIARRLDAVKVKGKSEPVAVFELLAMRDEAGNAAGFEWVALFEKGLDAYADRRWHEAAQNFRAVIDMRGQDAPSQVFLTRAEARIAAEPKHPVLASKRDQGTGAAE